MKKILITLLIVISTITYAQQNLTTMNVSVVGEGKIKVTPDQAVISFAIETKGNDAASVKKENDKKSEGVLKFLRSTKLAKEDYQTNQLSLYPQYDYNTKKNYYFASQAITVKVKDLNILQSILKGITDNGVNRIDNVAFESSQMEKLKSEARKLAMLDAKKKAEDYTSAIGQKVGIALSISDNSKTYNPAPIYKNYAMADAELTMDNSYSAIAIGEIEITNQVYVTFALN